MKEFVRAADGTVIGYLCDSDGSIQAWGRKRLGPAAGNEHKLLGTFEDMAAARSALSRHIPWSPSPGMIRCHDCEGTGRFKDDECNMCAGTGRIPA